MAINPTGSILVRRGPTVDRLQFCPLNGEIIYDTDLKKLFIGDGQTLGGLSVIGVPAGGLAGQVLSKNTNTDYDVIWSTVTGGSGGSGGSGGTATLTTASVLEVLSNAITETQLYSDLRSRINLIDGDHTLANSVNARIKTIVDNANTRIAAAELYASELNTKILTEAQLRASALLDAVSTLNAAIDNEKTTRQTSIQSIASDITTIHSSLNANTAAIELENTTRTTETSALATSLSTIAARLNNFNGTNETAESFITSERTSRIAGDVALAQDITTLTSRVGTAESTITNLYTTTQTQATSLTSLTTRLGTAESNITSLNTTTSSQAQSLTSLTSRLDTAESSISTLLTTTPGGTTDLTQINTRLGDAESAITLLNTTTATQAQTLTSLTSRVGSAESTISTLNTTTASQADSITQLITTSSNNTSAITLLQQTSTSQASTLSQLVISDSAHTSSIADFQSVSTTQASQITQLNTSVNSLVNIGIEQKFTTTATDIANLYAEYTLKIDTNGHVAGFGLASSPTSSDFVINANKFYITAPTDYSSSSEPTTTVIGKTWYNTTNKKTYRWDGTSWVLFEPIIPFTVQTTPTVINGKTINPGVYIDTASVKNLNAENINIDSLSVLSDNLGVITAGTFKTSNNENDHRVEISNTGNFPLWYGAGIKNATNANFYIDTLGNMVIKGGSFSVLNSSGNTILTTGGAVWDYVQGSNKPADGATRNVFTGVWASGTNYVVGDIVNDSYGNGWICILNHTSSDTIKPPTPPTTSNTYWNTYVSKGADAITTVVPNSTHTFSASDIGAINSYLGSGTTITLYEGSELLTYDGVGSSVTTTGTWKISSTTPTNITCGTLTISENYLTVGDHSGVADNIDNSSITYNIIGKRFNGSNFVYTVSQSFSKSKATPNITVYSLSLSSPVITKTSPDAESSGTHSSVVIQGTKYIGNAKSNYGWITVTGNGDTESTTATDTASSPYTLSPSNTAGKSSYRINMYNNSVVSSATLLDYAVIPVLFSGDNVINVILSNETHILPADSNGVVDLLHGYDGSGTRIQVLDGNVSLQYDGQGLTNGTWKVDIGSSINVTPGTPTISGTDVVYGNHSGVSNSIDVSTINYVITGKHLNGASFSITKSQTLTKSKTGAAYVTVIESTNGSTFRVGYNRSTILKAHVFLNGIEVTDIIPSGDFRWRRVSMYPDLSLITDTAWNNLYIAGYKQVTINVDEVDSQATFFCDIIN